MQKSLFYNLCSLCFHFWAVMLICWSCSTFQRKMYIFTGSQRKRIEIRAHPKELKNQSHAPVMVFSFVCLFEHNTEQLWANRLVWPSVQIQQKRELCPVFWSMFELVELLSSLSDIVFFLCQWKQVLKLKENNKWAQQQQQPTKKKISFESS